MWVLLRRKTITNGVCDNVQVPMNTLVRRRYHFCSGCVRHIKIKGTKKQKLDIILQPKNSKLKGSSQKRVWPKMRFLSKNSLMSVQKGTVPTTMLFPQKF